MDDTPQPRTRWYRPTPDRFVLALLAVEVLLWVSERFGWLAWHKGYAVLTAVAAVVVAVLLMLVWLAAALAFRRQFQFSIRWLLVTVVVVALPCSWLAVEVRAAKRQKEAVAVNEKLNGDIGYDYQHDASGGWISGAEPPRPAWLGDLLGDDFFADVVWGRVCNKPVFADTDLHYVEALSQLQWLELMGTDVTDAGLEHLKGLRRLRELHLEGNSITDVGLEHLKGMSRLEALYLGSARRDYFWVSTNVTAAGVKKLQKALPNCFIDPPPPAGPPDDL